MNTDTNKSPETEKQVLVHPWQGHNMEAAFVSFVRRASVNDVLMEKFKVYSGVDVFAPISAIDTLIDKASGYDMALAQQFIDWCVTQFGTPEQVLEDKALFNSEGT